MADPTLEFLAVCNDSAVMEAVTFGIQKIGGILETVNNTKAAGEKVLRRKIDGIVIDTRVPDALDLVQKIRGGKSNRHSIVFACVERRTEAASVIAAGATFTFYRPVTREMFLQMLQATAAMMMVERRRYFRHNMSIPITFSDGQTQSTGTISNLSETGMAIHADHSCTAGSVVSFSFNLPDGPRIEGKGQVIWADRAGNSGIHFQFPYSADQHPLSNWLASLFK